MKNILLASILSIGILAQNGISQEFLWIEAESGSEYKPIIVKSDVTASQEIYLASWESEFDGRIEFNFSLQSDQVYYLWGRMKVPREGDSPYRIRLNDEEVTYWAAYTEPASEIQEWKWINAFSPMSPGPGEHSLVLYQNRGGPLLQLDKILITSDENFTPLGLGGAEVLEGEANSFRSSVVSDHGQLKVQNGQLVDQNNQALQLQGISTHGLQWFPLIEQQTIPNMAEFFGIEVVRLAMYVEDIDPANPDDFWNGYIADPEGMMTLTKKAIDDAIAAGIYVIVDWHIHNIPGTYIAQASNFFQEIALEYAQYPNIIYEIANEPLDSATWGNVEAYANVVIPLIRSIDPDSVIIVGSPNWSRDIHYPIKDPLPYDNLMYAFHYYAGQHDFHDMSAKVRDALNAGLAIFVSEWGTTDVGTSWNNWDSSELWMGFMNDNNLSWINWSLGNKDENSSILNPRASMAGPWTENDLSESGAWVAQYFDAPNPDCTDNCINNRPLAFNKDVVGEFNETADIQLEGEDSDGSVAYFNIENYPQRGSISLSGARASYTPQTGFVGNDSFTYTAIDNKGEPSLPATVNINIKPEVDPEPSLNCTVFNEVVWNQGFTTHLQVSNRTDKPIYGWQVTISLGEGESLNHGWSANWMGTTGDLRAGHLFWNAVLSPGQTQTIGLVGNHEGSHSLSCE